MATVRHVWVRRNYGNRWMPGVVVAWRRTASTASPPGWDALCVVVDEDRSWLEWFATDELVPIRVDEPSWGTR